MNRRNFLKNIQNFAYAYGVSGILSHNSFAQASEKKYLINFVIKYTGGTTDENGVGFWRTDNGSLSSLSPYSSDLLIPLGFDIKFNHSMNAHHVNASAALTGATTEVILEDRVIEGEFDENGKPKMRTVQLMGAELKNMGSQGAGKSFDLIVGEHLKKIHKCALPYISIGNQFQPGSTVRATSSWDNFKHLYSINKTSDLATTIKNRINCAAGETTNYHRQLAALELIKQNQNVFQSKYIIDKGKFNQLEQMTLKNINHFKSLESTSGASSINAWANHQICKGYPTNEYADSSFDKSIFMSKMNEMYDLGIIALQSNVTRVLTFNLNLSEMHDASHHEDKADKIKAYVDLSKKYHESIASFIKKLKASDLYDESMIYCNSGSGLHSYSHSYTNQSIYILNSGKSGVVNNAGNRIGLSALLRAMLKKYGINYSSYGGTNYEVAGLPVINFI